MAAASTGQWRCAAPVSAGDGLGVGGLHWAVTQRVHPGHPVLGWR